MPLDVKERQELAAKLDKDIINDDSINTVYLKAFLTLVQRASELNLKLDLTKISNEMLSDPEKVRDFLSKFKEQWLELAATGVMEEVIMYKTSQLAKFFGVSITSINKWIDQGRFIGIKRSKENKHVRIPENTKYRNPGGKIFTISEIVDIYEREMTEQQRLEEEDQDMNEFDFLVKICADYESKYGDQFHKTLGIRADEELTAEERTDKAAWNYFAERLAHAKREED